MTHRLPKIDEKIVLHRGQKLISFYQILPGGKLKNFLRNTAVGSALFLPRPAASPKIPKLAK